MADNGRSIVTRDLELEALRQQEEKMRLEIVQLKENIDKLVLSVKLMAQLTTMTQQNVNSLTTPTTIWTLTLTLSLGKTIFYYSLCI